MNKYIRYFRKDKFASLSGIELIECSPGYAKAQVEISPEHLNGANIVHGGLIYTLADFSFAAAVNSYGFVTLSVNAAVSYFEKCNSGIITAEAKVLSKSNRLIHCDVSIMHHSGKQLANFKGTAYITKEEIDFNN